MNQTEASVCFTTIQARQVSRVFLNCILANSQATLIVYGTGVLHLKPRIVTSAFILIFRTLIWSAPTLAQGTIYKWIDSDGRLHYSNTPTDEACSVDAEPPPATSFGTPAASPAPIAAVSPPGTPTSDEAQGPAQGMEADFVLGKDGPFGAVEGDEPPLDDY